ncbi:MAG: hypothetical protein U9M95_01920 [Candidatus Altiarchaeota archaeon]|nr:hypothetical protein [Candidatus Altiarchaeota archaeon]
MIKKSMLVLLVVSITLGGLGGSAGAWTRNMDFESGLTGADGFTTAGTTVYWDSSEVHSGNHSARVYFEQGDNCWDAQLSCGAMYNDFPEDVLCGEELWTRAYYYFPDGWDWGDQQGGCNSPYRKILRFSLSTAGGGYAGGYVSIIAYWNLPNDGEVYASNEPGSYGWPHGFTGVSYPVGEWFCLEQYVVFGTSDETARHIIWLNEDKVFDSADIPDDECERRTMLDPTDHCGGILFFTAWNCYIRTSQNAYIDNVIVTTDTPTNTDAGGFPMIGQDDVNATAPARSNPSPTGTLPSGTTSTNISLSTNVQAVCRYSNVSGTDYTNMIGSFTSTNSTNHSTLATGLENGQTYTFYVRCNSTEGYFNDDDFNITFSVDGHKADLNDDGIIDMSELIAFISKWKVGDGVTRAEVEEARGIWFGGGSY